MSEIQIPNVMGHGDISEQGLAIMVSLMTICAHLGGELTTEQAMASLNMTREQYAERVYYAMTFGKLYARQDHETISAIIERMGVK